MKKKMFNCYQAYKGKTSTLDNCRNQIIELVFKNKKYFQLQSLPDDLQSNLIILLHNSLESILTKYNPQYGSFVTYLAATIKGLKTRCFREYYRKQATELISCDYCRSSALEKSTFDPIDVMIADISNTTPRNKSLLIQDTSFLTNKKLFSEKKLRNQNISKMILVLTLKSSYFISSDMIKKMSYYTKQTSKEIETMCYTVKELLKPRIIKYTEKMQQINREFLLKNRSYHELQYQQEGTYTYETRLKAYQFHKKRWVTMLTNKPSPSYLCPKNHEIATLLNISEDQVYYILHKIKKDFNRQDFLNLVLLEYDNLHGNREPPQKV